MSWGEDMNRNKSRHWTTKEIEFLRENYFKMTKSELSRTLGRTINSIDHAAGKLGLYEDRVYKKFSDEQIEILKNNYPTASIDWLKENLNATEKQIRYVAQKLGLRRKKGDVIQSKPIGVHKDRVNDMPVTSATIAIIYPAYLRGESIEQIADDTCRTIHQVKEIIEKCERSKKCEIFRNKDDITKYYGENHAPMRHCTTDRNYKMRQS